MGGICRILVVAAFFGCASVSGDSTGLLAMLEREAPASAMNPIEHPTGLFRATVPGRLLAALVDSDNSAFGQFDIGAETPVACHFFFDRVDLASTLVRSSDVIVGLIAAEAGVEVQRAVERVDAGAIAGSPFLSLDWVFWIGTTGGEIKQRAANRFGRTVYCAHDSPGYAKSFERFFASLIETLEYPGERTPEAFYREVSVTSIGEQRVGVIEITFVRDHAGEVRAEKFSSALTASTANSVRANDAYQVEWSHPNGDLVNAHYAALDDGAVTELRLTPARGSGWSVAGRFRSRPLTARFESRGPLSSNLGEYLVYREVAAGGDDFSLERWLPESDPTHATPFDFTRAGHPGADGIPVGVRMGSLRVDLLLTEDGRLRAASMRIGEVELFADVVHREGAI